MVFLNIFANWSRGNKINCGQNHRLNHGRTDHNETFFREDENARVVFNPLIFLRNLVIFLSDLVIKIGDLVIQIGNFVNVIAQIISFDSTKYQ